MYGPICFWLSSQLYNLGELRKYRVADNNKKGVVGRIGKKIPIIPKANDRLPNIINMTRYIYLENKKEHVIYMFFLL